MKKQRVWMIVGPDMTGKTHIAKRLEEDTGFHVRYFKASSEHASFLGDQKSFLQELRYADPRVCDFIRQVGCSVIMDRAYPCEYAYAMFFGRETDGRALEFIDEQYAALGAKVLICTRKSFAGIKDDLNPRIDETALTKLSGLYQDFARWTKCQTYTLYVDDEDLDREVREAMDFLNGDNV